MAILLSNTLGSCSVCSEGEGFKGAVKFCFSQNVGGRTRLLLTTIVDQENCIISVETLGNSWVYYLKEIKPDSVMIDEHSRKISFEGDNTVVEHSFEGLPKVEKDNKNSITLRGDIERTKDALKLILTKC